MRSFGPSATLFMLIGPAFVMAGCVGVPDVDPQHAANEAEGLSLGLLEDVAVCLDQTAEELKGALDVLQGRGVPGAQNLDAVVDQLRSTVKDPTGAINGILAERPCGQTIGEPGVPGNYSGMECPAPAPYVTGAPATPTQSANSACAALANAVAFLWDTIEDTSAYLSSAQRDIEDLRATAADDLAAALELVLQALNQQIDAVQDKLNEVHAQLNELVDGVQHLDPSAFVETSRDKIQGVVDDVQTARDHAQAGAYDQANVVLGEAQANLEALKDYLETCESTDCGPGGLAYEARQQAESAIANLDHTISKVMAELEGRLASLTSVPTQPALPNVPAVPTSAPSSLQEVIEGALVQLEGALVQFEAQMQELLDALEDEAGGI